MKRATLFALVFVSSCQTKRLDFAGFPCDAEHTCVADHVCHPEQGVCVPAIPLGCADAQICPSTTEDGDACPSAGSFLPCVDGVTDCSMGCRTCGDDLTWSACTDPIVTCTPTMPADEVCDGLDNDCDEVTDPEGAGGCTTYYADRDLDSFGDPVDSRCLCAPSTVYTATTGDDCADDDNSCFADCNACVSPGLTLSTEGAWALCADATVQIDLNGRVGEAASITCETNFQAVLDETNFTSGAGLWSSMNGITLSTWRDGFPNPSCKASNAAFARFNPSSESYLELGAPLDVSGYSALQLELLVGYKGSPVAGEDIDILACCGDACVLTLVDTVQNQASGGTDACTTYTVPLGSAFDGCNRLKLRLSFASSADFAGVDDLRLSGDPRLLVSEQGDGLYETTVRSCTAATASITCSFEDVSETFTDSIDVVFQ